jgi:hypothetical protein
MQDNARLDADLRSRSGPVEQSEFSWNRQTPDGSLADPDVPHVSATQADCISLCAFCVHFFGLANLR